MAGHPSHHPAPVWRSRSFRLLFGSTTASSVGSAIVLVVLPLLALGSLEATELEVGLLRSAQLLPFLVLAVPLGLLADRRSRRVTMLAADLARALIFAAIALLAANDLLAFPILLVLAATAGCCSVAYELGFLSAMPDVVDTDRLQVANRATEIAQSGAGSLGPLLAGVLMGAISAAGAVLCSAASYAISSIALAANRWTERPRPREDDPVRALLLAGFRFVARDPYVGPMLAHLGVKNVFLQAFQTALLVLLAQSLGLSPALVGLVVAAIGVGFLAGAATSPPLSARLGVGSIVILASLVGGAGIMLVAVPGTGAVLPAVGALAAGAGTGLFNLQSIAVRQAVTPPEVLGRVNAAVKLVSYSAMSAGAFLGGYLSGVVEPATVILGSGIGASLSTLFLLAPAVRRMRQLPSPPT